MTDTLDTGEHEALWYGPVPQVEEDKDEFGSMDDLPPLRKVEVILDDGSVEWHMVSDRELLTQWNMLIKEGWQPLFFVQPIEEVCLGHLPIVSREIATVMEQRLPLQRVHLPAEDPHAPAFDAWLYHPKAEGAYVALGQAANIAQAYEAYSSLARLTFPEDYED